MEHRFALRKRKAFIPLLPWLQLPSPAMVGAGHQAKQLTQALFFIKIIQKGKPRQDGYPVRSLSHCKIEKLLFRFSLTALKTHVSTRNLSDLWFMNMQKWECRNLVTNDYRVEKPQLFYNRILKSKGNLNFWTWHWIFFSLKKQSYLKECLAV